jgi:hypothetical protein
VDWFGVGVVLAVVTAALMGAGFRLERRRPGLRWPIIIVGALLGLALGLVMALAFWAIQVRPHARRAITASAIVLGAGFTLFATDLLFGPSFDVGPVIGSGRIERPEHGFALTFPASWTVQEVTPEGAQTFLGGEQLLEGQSAVLAAQRWGQSSTCVVYVDDPSLRDAPVLLSRDVDGAVTELRQDGSSGTIEPARIDLASGLAWRIDHLIDDVPSSMYVLRGHDGYFLLYCLAADPPHDRWLSIADTFEFLPNPVTGSVPSSPVLGSGRIERPEEGFAITVPDDWTVEEVDPAAHAWLFDSLDPAERALRTTVLWADQPDSDGFCTIVDFTRLAEEPPPWTSVEAATASYWFASESNPEIVRTESSIEDLPAGRVGHIIAADTDDWTYGAYYFTDGDAWLYLECWSPDPPEDEWLSVAQSFEFLPGRPTGSPE